jgi:hypothetical protein
MAALPNLGWAIGLSDAVATVDLVVNGTEIQFTGVGYHDSKTLVPPIPRYSKL